jgi:EAL domain-containing protein (putative c-di-GMP-specific phosphodiesterase class I)
MHKELLSATFLIELMEKQRYGVEYQPIIDIKNQQIFAFECLARFFDADNTSIRPDIVYASLHKSPLSLYQVEYQQKILQLENAPTNTAIFVNLDQDSYFSSGVNGPDNPFLTLFSAYKKTQIIVELIENSEINDAIMSLSMIDLLSKNKINTAIDDVCNPQSMISTSVIQLVDFIKLDKYVVRNRQDENFMHLVNSIINYAHLTGKRIILEGIETTEDLLFARRLNVDYVQGFLYRNMFINIR